MNNFWVRLPPLQIVALSITKSLSSSSNKGIIYLIKSLPKSSEEFLGAHTEDYQLP